MSKITYLCHKCGHSGTWKLGNPIYITGDTERKVEVTCHECGDVTPIDE